MTALSPAMQAYFDHLDAEVKRAYDVAENARQKGYDPEPHVSIPLAKNMAERVEGIVSVAAPQLKNSGVSNRIIELEKEYGTQNWKIAFIVSLEVAQEKYCTFKDKREAMEVGLRIGLAYITNGVVASPLEGFVRLELKKRQDNQEYFCLFFSGPIRSAGTTATCIFVGVADYVRVNMGYAPYDPTEQEIKRTFSELEYFHERVANLQYFPSEREAEFLTSHLPVQIDGDPSEKFEVPNYKDLPRVSTNMLRNGFCLVMAEGISQKSAKFWGKFSKWNKEYGMEHWNFLEDYVKLQKEIKAHGALKKDPNVKISPDFTFIKDLVAGRPILSHPMRRGGFRLRYGRTRTSGFSSNAIHPATMFLLNNYIAIGTQLKSERPGKSTTITTCDRIEAPVIKLKNGTVVFIETIEQAKACVKDVQEIIFLGDMLVNYGDFLDRGHILAPPGYCEEWWARHLEQKCTPEERIPYTQLLKDPTRTFISCADAVTLSQKYHIPLHPRYTYHWSELTLPHLDALLHWLTPAVIKEQKIILPYKPILGEEHTGKRALELLGVPHHVIQNEYVVIEGEWADSLRINLGVTDTFIPRTIPLDQNLTPLALINQYAPIQIKDKSGLSIGARMGRPEKAKMRKMTGSPHTLFPIGKEGGRMRSLQSALEKGKVTSSFPVMYCPACTQYSVYPRCHLCDGQTEQHYYCKQCGVIAKPCEHKPVTYKETTIDITSFYDSSLKKTQSRAVVDLIKGVRGTSNKAHLPEHLLKGILRAKHRVHVNKDGTTRYDITEMAITHFKPKEIGTSVEKLISMGYTTDNNGQPLTNDDQVLELKCQDLILPACPVSIEEGCDAILFRTANFLDDLLEYLYQQPRYYNFQSKADLVGHIVIGLSPHTSAGIVCRIIGFTQTQGMHAHPLLHSIMRRDCFTKETYLPLFDGTHWKNIQIGAFVETLNPTQKVDLFGTLAKKVNTYWTHGLDTNGKPAIVKVQDFTKHQPSKILKIKTSDGRTLRVTETHKIFVNQNGSLQKISAAELREGMALAIPYNATLQPKDVSFLDLHMLFSSRSDIVLRNIRAVMQKCIDKLGGIVPTHKKFGLPRRSLYNFIRRDSFPIELAFLLLTFTNTAALPHNTKIGVKRDTVSLPHQLPLNKETLWMLGLYTAEGFSRKNNSKKGYYQVDFAVSEQSLRDKLYNIMYTYFNVTPSCITPDRFTYSSRILYELFVDILKLGSNAYEKNIPSLILNLPSEKLAWYLQGYFDGDGSVSLSDLRVCCDSVSEHLLQDLEFALKRYGIFTKRYWYKKKPGPQVRAFYITHNKEIPEFAITKLIVPSNFCSPFYEHIGFALPRKQDILRTVVQDTKPRMKILFDTQFAYPVIRSITEDGIEPTYCLNVENHAVTANGILTGQCDGDEAGVMLIMDALLNFSKHLLSDHRGATQDEPLVLTTTLIPAEVDDMVFNMDIVENYPLAFYDACEAYKMPAEVQVETLRQHLGKPTQYEGYRYTHETDDINIGVQCSGYKTIPTMEEKVVGQMELAERIRAVDAPDVARLVIERHFLRDIKGNLRKFSTQQFRCVDCNAKFRRPPLKGICTTCNGKLLFTISEGSVIKYMQPCMSLIEKYNLPPYLKQTLELTQQRIEMVFGRAAEKQEGLGRWF